MNYKFDITVTEEDYLQYNTFVNLKSYYGKRKRMVLAVMITMVLIAFSFFIFISNGFSSDSWVSVIVMAVAALIVFAFFPVFVKSAAKGAIRNGKRSGKPWYTPKATMEFYEDYFIEQTEEVKTEAKYSRIERVSINKGRAIYIHMNMTLGYMIPLSAFKDRIEYDDFIELLRSKSITIDE